MGTRTIPDRSDRRSRRPAVAIAVAAIASTAAATATRHRFRNWGATPDERARQLPGDDLIDDTVSVSTRAITVHAPPAEVWQWLVQIGQDRGGWYSYQGLENLFGLDIYNTDEIRAEWQRLDPGDRVWVAPPGAIGMKDGYAFRVAVADPGRALVLRQSPPEHPWNATWAFILTPDGWGGTRLLVRSRSARINGATGRLATLGGEMLDPITLIMTRKMLLGIKARAEFAHQKRLRDAAHAEHRLAA